MGLMAASKAFFKLLFNKELSESFQQLVDGRLQPKLESKPAKPVRKSEPKPKRSDAISLHSALQREARFLDIVSESLGDYSDAQVGAAARDVLRDSGKVIERMFSLRPLTEVEDGASIETPSNFDPAEYRLTGNVSGDGPFSGNVAHHGWKATKCDVPQWSGNKKTEMIVAPIEVEIA